MPKIDMTPIAEFAQDARLRGYDDDSIADMLAIEPAFGPLVGQARDAGMTADEIVEAVLAAGGAEVEGRRAPPRSMVYRGGDEVVVTAGRGDPSAAYGARDANGYEVDGVEVVAPRRGFAGWLGQAGSDAIRGRIGAAVEDLGAARRQAGRTFKRRDFDGDYYGMHGPAPLSWDARRAPRARQTAFPNQPTSGDDPYVRNIRPNDVFGINKHAIFGDGSPREADFRAVNLDDLDGSIRKIAKGPSRLRDAINDARATGRPVPLSMTQVRAGGDQGGRTGPSQIGGVGRFSVHTDGAVSVGRDGHWEYDAMVRGEPDKQDYPPDPRRGRTAAALTAAFGSAQRIFGGKDYPLTFFGSQNRRVKDDNQ